MVRLILVYSRMRGMMARYRGALSYSKSVHEVSQSFLMEDLGAQRDTKYHTMFLKVFLWNS
jgi:hypothetical protein